MTELKEMPREEFERAKNERSLPDAGKAVMVNMDCLPEGLTPQEVMSNYHACLHIQSSDEPILHDPYDISDMD